MAGCARAPIVERTYTGGKYTGVNTRPSGGRDTGATLRSTDRTSGRCPSARSRSRRGRGPTRASGASARRAALARGKPIASRRRSPAHLGSRREWRAAGRLKPARAARRPARCVALSFRPRWGEIGAGAGAPRPRRPSVADTVAAWCFPCRPVGGTAITVRLASGRATWTIARPAIGLRPVRR